MENLRSKIDGLRSPLQHPTILCKPGERAYDSFADGELWLPAKRTYACRIKKNEGIVADPATITAGVMERGRQAKMADYPTDRVIDLAIFAGAKVEDVGLGLRMPDGMQDRVDAVVDIEVRLPLPAVAEHIESCGIGQQLLVEIGLVKNIRGRILGSGVC